MPGPGFALPDLCSICTADEHEELAEAVRGGFSADGYPLGDNDPPAPPANGTDRAIRLSTAVAVLAVAGIAAYVSYWHAYAVVRVHGETGITARLEPTTIDGLVYASSMVVLYAARHRMPVPSLARWLLGLGIAATLTANMAQGWSHGLAGAVVAAWPAVSLVGSYELSQGVPRLSHDVAPERFAEGFCNTSRRCGARCCRCSEAWPARTCHMYDNPAGRRRVDATAATCTIRPYARFAPVFTPRERTPGLADPDVRSGGTRAVGRTPLQLCGLPCCDSFPPDFGRRRRSPRRERAPHVRPDTAARRSGRQAAGYRDQRTA